MGGLHYGTRRTRKWFRCLLKAITSEFSLTVPSVPSSNGSCQRGTIQGEVRRFISTTFIYGENPWIEHHVHIDGELPTDYVFITGIPYPNGAYNEDVKQGWVWGWGTDPRGMDTLGVALIILTGGDPENAGLDASQTDFSSLPVILTPNADGRLTYRTFAIWGGGIDGIETETEFAQHVQITTTALKTPPQIKFLPPEEEQ